MKKNLLIAAIAAVAVFGCTSKQKEATFVPGYTEVSEKGNVGNNPEIEISASVSASYPKEGTPANVVKALEKSVVEFVLSDSVSTSFNDAASALVKKFTGDAVREASSPDFADMPPYARSRTLSLEGKFATARYGVTSYILNVRTYTGGVHGMYATQGALFSLFDGHRVHQDEFFVPGYKDNLTTLIRKHLDRENLTGMELFSQPEPNDNMYFTQEGIVFTYVPYEIAPYAVGELQSKIPWAEVEPLISEKYKGKK